MMPKDSLLQMLEAMWQDYLQLNPEAQQIYSLFAQANTKVVNDHIALRCFDLPGVNIQQLSRPFIAAGYQCGGEYEFVAKKLYAQHFQHPDTSLPKIFISELLCAELSASNQQLIQRLVGQINPQRLQEEGFCYSGRHWDISYAEYLQLLDESEYAAWVAAFGFRPNHFTIFVNALTSHPDIEAVNEFLITQGFQLNQVGGLVKGGPDELLAQSSTLANKIPVQFSDQQVEIPSCYYEFAKRYPQTDGSLYQGFVASSADKIFESTDAR